jgi:methionine sulfoxide reductase heme-binding subunit
VIPATMEAATFSAPSPLWFASRGAGVVTLAVLTATVVLGIGTSLRWQGPRSPRFLTASLHRNLSLFAITLLAVHIVTSVLDPFAGIRPVDAAIPFLATYRPFWLGMGVLAAEALLAVAVTSLFRRRLGARGWRLIHWGAYAPWPPAVVHGLGTGTDVREPWLIGLTSACVVAVMLALAERLVMGRRRTAPVRMLAAGVTVAVLVVTCSWAARGPLRPGWAAAAGTPASILKGSFGASPDQWRSRSTGFVDALIGSMTATRDGAAISFRDAVDPALTLTILPPAPAQMAPVLSVARNGQQLCSSPAAVGTKIYAVCGATRLLIELRGSPARLTGTLTASGPLG